MFVFAGFNLLLIFGCIFFVGFAVALFVHRNFFAFEDYLYRALRLIFVFAGFNCFGFHIRWIQRAVDLMRFFLYLKIILTGRYSWPWFRWIQLF